MPDWQGLASNITQFCLNRNILNHSQTLILKSFTDPLKIISYCIQETEEKKQQVSLNQHLQKLFIDDCKVTHDLIICNRFYTGLGEAIELAKYFSFHYPKSYYTHPV